MMKLVIAIVHHSDGDEILQALTAAGLRVTRIASSGGFLNRGNATFMIGVEEQQVQPAIRLVREHTAPPVDPGLKRATIFVLKVDRYEQI